MARVFVATERALGRQVVIKTLPDEGWSASAAQRFHREILTAAQLQHANIVPVLTAGDAEGMPYFTMPLIDGATLRERIARGRVPLSEAIGILRDVARALHAAHARNVVHRDIKPENILLSAGAALVSDFGVAKALSVATQGPDASATMTAIGVSVGTPAYMSPEQVAADPSLDHRTDIYAWGVVAYELLAGQRPFAELSGTALMKAQMGTMPPALSTQAPTVPAALAALVMRCLAKEPTQRPQSAAELLAILDLPSGETQATRGRSAPVRLLAGAVAAAIVVAGSWWFVTRGSAAASESTIAVAPFRVGGLAPEARYLREGLGDIIVPQLQTLPEISAAGMRVMLDRWQRIGGDAEADLEDAEASRAAIAAGAGRLILGDVVGTRERLTVNARLIRTRDGRELARARVDGSADSAFALATRLVTTLLSISDGATRDRLQSVLSANPDAIAPYLVGEQFYRRGRYSEAGESFLAAYNADTTFAIAALRIGLTNGWSLANPIPGPWGRRAWTHRARLSGADSLLLLAEVGETYPRPMHIRERIRSLAALAERSNSAEVWYAYADYLIHIGESVDEPNVYQRALRGFAEAERIDSSFTPALEHQAHIYLVLGDSVNARRAHARQARQDSTGDFFMVNDFTLQVDLGSLDDQMRAIERLARSRTPEDVVYAAMFSHVAFAGRGARMDITDSALHVLERTVRGQLSSLNARAVREIYWNSGRPSGASAYPIADGDTWGHVETVLAAVIWQADTAMARSSARALDAWTRRGATTDPDPLVAAAQFALAQRALAAGDTADVERRQRAIRSAGAAATQPWLANTHRTLDAAIGAQLAVARRSPTARAAVETLDSLLLDTPNLERRGVRTTGNMVLASLWERLGESQLAIRAANRRDGQSGYGMYHAERLRIVARSARALGQADVERAALQEFVDMRGVAEPALQPEVERFRARLAELNAQAAR